MTWRFTILHNNIETIIDEPVGWSSITKVIQRDSDTHGVMFDFSANTLSFSEEAYWILTEEYTLHGVDGKAGMRIEWLCNDCDDYQFFYEGKFDFEQYKKVCGEDCYVSIGLQKTTAETLINNRMETSVDLTSNKAYDGTTVLTDYPGLNKEISVPSKALLLKAEANTVPFEGDDGGELTANPNFYDAGRVFGRDGFILPKLNNTTIDEIPTFSPKYLFEYYEYSDLNASIDGHHILNIDPSGVPAPTNQYDVNYRFKGSLFIEDKLGPLGSGETGFITVELRMALKYGNAKTDAFSPVLIESYFNTGDAGYDHRKHTINFDFSWTGPVNLGDNEKVWPLILLHHSANKFGIANPFYSVKISFDPESYFHISSRNYTNPSLAKTYLVHEAGSRIIESITNNAYKLKSEYYGRTDSMPYSFPSDGCGGLRTLTNGLQLRRAVLQNNSSPKVFLSLKDYFDSLNAIDCIGLGIEGNDVRVEPIKYFYSDDIIFTADGVNEITTTPRKEKIWNQFNFGFDKFETESANGLNAIHTKREYRTEIVNSKNKLEAVSKIIADGNAIEATRRKAGSTDDWRYDQNIFILCLTRGGKFIVGYGSTGILFYTVQSVPTWAVVGSVLHITAEETDALGNAPIPSNTGDFTIVSASIVSGHLFIQTSPGFSTTKIVAGAKIKSSLYTDVSVDQGNIANPENIFDPPTVINYAITPVRNALRWFAWLVQGIRSYTTTKVLFSSGEGNYVAKGKLNNGCVTEAAAIAENDPLSAATFQNPDDAAPFTDPDKDSFKYPMGLNEFVSVAINPYGKIQYRKKTTDDWSYGWIDNLKYTPEDGEAEFSLIISKS